MPSVPWSGAPSVAGMSATVMAMRSGAVCAWAGLVVAKGREAAARSVVRRDNMVLSSSMRNAKQRLRHCYRDAHGRGTKLAVQFIMMTEPNALTATELSTRIDAGTLTAEAIVRSCLERI